LNEVTTLNVATALDYLYLLSSPKKVLVEIFLQKESFDSAQKKLFQLSLKIVQRLAEHFFLQVQLHFNTNLIYMKFLWLTIII
jgi:hypothetical protein